MIKLVYCITKKAGLTDEEFFRYWENIHGPIGARVPRLRKLVQSHRMTLPEDRYRSDYDGMAELWFDDLEALLAARQSPEWKASTADEANFIDQTKVASPRSASSWTSRKQNSTNRRTGVPEVQAVGWK